ncbi:unnamed protein product [Effrenium voratum]|nr:unnamed protein product [Effrenium voratum]
MLEAALLKLKQSISATFSGSSDPEAFDCVHIVDHLRCKFSEPRHLKVCFEQLYQRARAVEPAWVHPQVAQCVPEAPGPQQEAGEGWLFIWQLAHEDGCSLKGRSNMVNILETAFSILENTFNSGSLAIKMILLAMVNLSNEELRAVFPVLRSLFTVKFTYNPAPNEEVQRHRSLSAKFQVSESHRPDPIQIYHVLADSLAKAGQDVAAGLPRKIKEYNSLTSVQSQCISELEARVICLLPQQTVKFRETLAYHWQNYKNAESGVPMKLFGKSGILGADAPAEASGVWKEILKPSAEKNECFLLHIIHVFVKSLKDALRMKKKPNLRFHANKFRVSDPVSAYYQACLWVHFRPEMQKEMSGDEFEQLERTFLRGSLERELADRVKAMNPTLKLGDFRFLYLHLGKDAPAGKEPIELEAAQEVAEFEQEKASLRLFKAKLDKDVSLWTKYCTSLADFTSMQKVGKVEFLRHQDRMISEAVEKQADAQFPIRCLGLSDNVAPFVSSCASTWAEKQIIPACSLFTVYIANLTSLGSAASRGMKEVARLISDACAHNAQRTMAIIISPNVAGHGHTYEEQETVQVQDEVENFLRKEEYNLKTRRGQIVFSNESINSRTRPSVHPMIMCMSNQTKDDGELACLFGSSQLWHRRAVPLVKMKPNSEYVLPMQGQTVVAAENLSKAQMHKQHISGVDLMDKLKEWLWKGMNMSQQFGAVYVDLLPYDDSLLLSTVQGLARARPKEPQEMVVTCCWARGDQDGDVRKKNAEWLTAAVGRAMDRLIRQKLLSLPNVVVKEYTPEGTTPTNDSSLYSLTFPTADGNLAMRQNALDEWGPKFARLKSDYEEAIASHNKLFNSSGCPYKADGRKRAGEAIGEELRKAHGNLSTVHSSQPELFNLIFTSKGHLFLHALEDGVASAKVPLFQTFGEFHTGDADIAKVQKRKGHLCHWKMDAADFEAIWSHPAGWDPAFQRRPATFQKFADYLADHNVVTFSVACHEVSLEGSDGIKVKSVEDCAFEAKKLPARAVADLTNCGSLLTFAVVDWEKGQTTNGALKLVMSFSYEDSSQQKGVFPAKPCWMLAKPKRVLKDKCFLVCGPGKP